MFAGRHHQVQQTVVIEVVHDGATGLVQTIDAQGRCDIDKAADVYLGLEGGRRQAKRGGHTVRVFPQSHGGDVEKPVGADIVGVGLQVLGEKTDGLPRALALLMNRLRLDGKNATRTALAVDAVFGLAPAQNCRK